MSEHSTPDEKTEMPTERRLEKLGKEGQLHSSTDIVTATSLLTGFVVIFLTWQWLLDDILLIMRTAFTMVASDQPLTPQLVYKGFVSLMGLIGPNLLLIMMLVAVMSSLALLIQTGWNVKEKKIHFQGKKINPINGIKRIFSMQGVINTFKAVAKLGIILPIAYFSLKAFAPQMIMLMHMTVSDVMSFTGVAIFDLFWKIMYVLIALAIIDFFWTKHQWLKQNKMTKHDVKDERKAMEGDEETKRRMQNKGLQRIVQRIRDSVPQADVVITNPTHYAIALKYDRDTMKAPKVVAKGKGFLALRIRELAKEAKVPILERKPLARALYAATEVGSEVPYELFKAVAEVLAYVYKLKNPSQRQAAGN